MRAPRLAVAAILALAAMPAAAQQHKRDARPGFAEPSDIIAAEGNFSHISADKGIKAAFRATAAADAQIFAPQLMRVSAYANADLRPAEWRTSELWMSCDGSIAVTHGQWQRTGAPGWYITVWRRQKGGGYKWVLAEGGALTAPLAQSDMIAASVADCPARRARGAASEPPAPKGKAPLADHQSGRADDGTLEWATTLAADGSRSFALQVKRDGALHEVLRATAAPGT